MRNMNLGILIPETSFWASEVSGKQGKWTCSALVPSITLKAGSWVDKLGPFTASIETDETPNMDDKMLALKSIYKQIIEVWLKLLREREALTLLPFQRRSGQSWDGLKQHMQAEFAVAKQQAQSLLKRAEDAVPKQPQVNENRVEDTQSSVRRAEEEAPKQQKVSESRKRARLTAD